MESDTKPTVNQALKTWQLFVHPHTNLVIVMWNMNPTMPKTITKLDAIRGLDAPGASVRDQQLYTEVLKLYEQIGK